MAAEQTVSTDGGDRRGAASRAHGDASSRWWGVEPGEEGKTPVSVHGKVVGYIQRLRAAWSRAEIFERLFDRLYENRSLRNNRAALETLDRHGYSAGRVMMTTSVVDTFDSRITRRRPMPMFVVDEGEWDLKQQAIEMRAFLHGKMRETGTDEISDQAGKDAIIRGSGIVYVDDEEEDVVVERVHRWELFVDPHEAKGGPKAVRQMHRVRRVAREVLCAEYPDFTAQIMAAPAARTRAGESGSEDWASPAGFYDVNDVVDLYESWHLPSRCDYEDDDPDMDGRHAVCLEGVTLRYERWNEKRFPFAILRRHLRQDSFWGQGDVERLAPLQHDINQIARDIQQNIEVGGKLYYLTSGNADTIPMEKMVGVRPLRVKGVRPGELQMVAPTAISVAHQQVLDSRIEYGYRFSGVADWAATARSPLGPGASGVAVETMEDLLSDRHASFETRHSAFRCMIGQLIIDAARRIAKRMKASKGKDGKTKKFYASWMDAGTLRRIAWEDAEIRDGKYRLEIEPAGFLPTSRGGRLKVLQELVSAGVIPQWAAQGAFEEPDVAHTNRIVLAKYHNAERMMQILGNPKKPAPVPLPYHDLDLLIAFAVAYYNRAECDRAPDEVLERYGAFIDLCVEEKKKANSSVGKAEIPNPAGMLAPTDPNAPAPMPGPMPGMPPGMPMPMPGGMPIG